MTLTDRLNRSVRNMVFTKAQKRKDILEVIFPESRSRVLRLLFTAPKKGRYGRELAQLSGLALSTTQEELATLVAADLIVAGKLAPGCRRYYRANRDHPLYPHLFGLLHAAGRLSAVDVSNLRSIRRPKLTKGLKPRLAAHPIRDSRPSGRGLYYKY